MSSEGFWKAIQGTSESSINDEKLCYDMLGANDRERAVAVRVASCFLPVIILQSLTMRMPSSSLDSHAVARDTVGCVSSKRGEVVANLSLKLDVFTAGDCMH